MDRTLLGELTSGRVDRTLSSGYSIGGWISCYQDVIIIEGAYNDIRGQISGRKYLQNTIMEFPYENIDRTVLGGHYSKAWIGHYHWGNFPVGWMGQ